MMYNPYQILGVEQNAPIEVCKKAHRKLCVKYHPDNGGDANKFDEVNKAFEAIESGKFDTSNFVIKHSHLRHKTLFTFVEVA